MQLTEAIKKYILYLKKECKLLISLHVSDFDGIVLSDDLMQFNIHDNSYCSYIKSSIKAQKCCVQKQKRVIEKCSTGAFCGVCHAGVKEFIYPINNNGVTVGFISVSGYKSDNASKYIDVVSKKYKLSKEKLISAYDALKNDIPAKTYIDTLITPLCCMLDLAYQRQTELQANTQSFCGALVEYIKQNHTQNINSEDICRHFSCSRSTISHKFNKHMRMSIKSYINILRIEDAKYLLKYSDLNITEIAFCVGFRDSNYFTGIFKKKVGMSPTAYRKSQ